MPKYRLKNKSYWKNLKGDMYCKEINEYVFYDSSNTSKTFREKILPYLIKQGWIEEVKESKWTDEEMFDYSKYIIMRYDELKNAIQEQNNVELEVKLNMFLMEYEKSRQTKNI